MENFDNIVNELLAKLLSTGSAEFSQDGLNIKTTYKDGNFNIEASFVSPEEDNETPELIENFKDYINSLNDDFFLEVAESFPEGRLHELQKAIDSKKSTTVKNAIDEFMHQLKVVAANKIQDLNTDIEKTEKELSELIEIRDSYVHVLNKKF